MCRDDIIGEILLSMDADNLNHNYIFYWLLIKILVKNVF